MYKIGFRTNDLCTFCGNQTESLTHLFYHCSRSKHFWIEFELYWCLISNQRIRLRLENVLIGILTENAACPLLQLLNYFIIIGKLYLWDCTGIKQILPNIYGLRAKIIAKYETEKKISNKEFFKEKVDTDALFKLTVNCLNSVLFHCPFASKKKKRFYCSFELFHHIWLQQPNRRYPRSRSIFNTAGVFAERQKTEVE